MALDARAAGAAPAVTHDGRAERIPQCYGVLVVRQIGNQSKSHPFTNCVSAFGFWSTTSVSASPA